MDVLQGVTNILEYNFKGEIIHGGINYLGSYHESKLASCSGLSMPRLSDETPEGMTVLRDSAFAVQSKATAGKLLRAKKNWGEI